MKILYARSIYLLFGLSASCFAELAPLSDAELTEISGGSILTVTRLDEGGIRPNGGDTDLAFVRIGLGLDVNINANFDEITMGEYDRTGYPAGSADIEMDHVSLGEIDEVTNAMTTFRVVDPYIELAFDDAPNPNNRQVAGFRIGARYIEGTMGALITRFSGDILVTGEIEDPLFGTITAEAVSNEPRATHADPQGFLASWLQAPDQPLTNFKTTEFRGTQNFYLSVQDRDINYPRIGNGPQGVAQAGTWANLQDGAFSPNLQYSLRWGGFFSGCPGDMCIDQIWNEYPNNCFNGAQGSAGCLSGR